MDNEHNKHYIRTDNESRIIAGFSDAFEQPQPSDICINEEGGYQFRLYPNGEENPLIRDEYGVPMYEWDGSAVVTRPPQDVEADRPEQSEPSLNASAFLNALMETYS